MKKTLAKMAAGISLMGILSACVPQKAQQGGCHSQSTLTRTQQYDRTPWSASDIDDDGVLDQLITPHRNSYYGTKGPVYARGDGDPMGQIALDMAKIVIEHKTKFAKMAGNSRVSPTSCRVDDFDNDGTADRISWPRIYSMPVLERPFTADMHEMGDTVVAYENYIINYIRYVEQNKK